MDIPSGALRKSDPIQASDKPSQLSNPISEPKAPTLTQTPNNELFAGGLFESFRQLRYIEQLSSLESFHLNKADVCAVLRDDWTTTLEKWCTTLGADPNNDESVAKVADLLFANLVSELKLNEATKQLYKKFYGDDASVAGMLAALHALQTNGLRQMSTEVIADVLLCLLALENSVVTKKGQQLMGARDKFLANLEDAKIQALKPYTRATHEQLICLLPEEVYDEYKKLEPAEQYQFLLFLPARFKKDFPEIAASIPKSGLDEILRSLGRTYLNCLQTIEQHRAREAAFEKTLVVQLVQHLPENIRYTCQTLMRELRTFEAQSPEYVAAKEALKILLCASHTSATVLCQSLRSRDEVFEALQITWAAPPLFCVRFAHDLIDLLSVHQNPALFLNEVRAHLIERLALNAQLTEEFQLLCKRSGAHDVATIMLRLHSDMLHVMTPWQRDSCQKTRHVQVLDSSAARNSDSALTAGKKPAEMFPDIVRWLRAQQLSARATRSLSQ